MKIQYFHVLALKRQIKSELTWKPVLLQPSAGILEPGILPNSMLSSLLRELTAPEFFCRPGLEVFWHIKMSTGPAYVRMTTDLFCRKLKTLQFGNFISKSLVGAERKTGCGAAYLFRSALISNLSSPRVSWTDKNAEYKTEQEAFGTVVQEAIYFLQTVLGNRHGDSDRNSRTVCHQPLWASYLLSTSFFVFLIYVLKLIIIIIFWFGATLVCTQGMLLALQAGITLGRAQGPIQDASDGTTLQAFARQGMSKGTDRSISLGLF